MRGEREAVFIWVGKAISFHRKCWGPQQRASEKHWRPVTVLLSRGAGWKFTELLFCYSSHVILVWVISSRRCPQLSYSLCMSSFAIIQYSLERHRYRAASLWGPHCCWLGQGRPILPCFGRARFGLDSGLGLFHRKPSILRDNQVWRLCVCAINSF